MTVDKLARGLNLILMSLLSKLERGSVTTEDEWLPDRTLPPGEGELVATSTPGVPGERASEHKYRGYRG